MDALAASSELWHGCEQLYRMAALAPEPRVNLTRCHDVFALNSKHRIQVTPGKRGKGREQAKVAANNWLEKTQERHRAMTWMQRLKRVFSIDIETCERCGGKVKVIASIEDPAVIAHILKHLKQKKALKADSQPHERPPERTPPGDEAVRLTFPIDTASRWSSVSGSNIHALLFKLKPMKISLNSPQSNY